MIKIEIIESLAFIGAEFAKVEVNNLRIVKHYTRGIHSKVEEKELTLYSKKLNKKEVISKIATALSKKSIRTKKQIEEFLYELLTEEKKENSSQEKEGTSQPSMEYSNITKNQSIKKENKTMKKPQIDSKLTKTQVKKEINRIIKENYLDKHDVNITISNDFEDDTHFISVDIYENEEYIEELEAQEKQVLATTPTNTTSKGSIILHNIDIQNSTLIISHDDIKPFEVSLKVDEQNKVYFNINTGEKVYTSDFTFRIDKSAIENIDRLKSVESKLENTTQEKETQQLITIFDDENIDEEEEEQYSLKRELAILFELMKQRELLSILAHNLISKSIIKWNKEKYLLKEEKEKVIDTIELFKRKLEKNEILSF